MKGTGRFEIIRAADIAHVLRQVSRQYLVGNLAKPQELPFMRDAAVEVGITKYQAAASEPPHWHLQQREYQLMVSGTTTYVESLTGIRRQFLAGDFFGIFPEICYSQVSEPGTEILFIKTPAVNDKVVCRACDRELCPARIEPFVPALSPKR